MKRFLLSLFIICSLTGYAYAQTELDYMEYATDGAAQTAYVTDAALVTTETITQTATSFDQGIDQATWIAFGQGFKVATTDAVTKITLRLFKSAANADGTATVYIYSDDGAGKPNASLATFSPAMDINTDLTTSATDYDFTGTYTPTIGTQYHIVIARTGGTAGALQVNTNADVYADGSFSRQDTESIWYLVGWDFYFKVWQDVRPLQCYSEDTIKQQGSYSLKGVAAQTDSLNDTLTRTVDPTIDLSGLGNIKYDIYALRTGSNIKISIRDSGGTTTEHTANVASSNTNQTESWDISGVADANKDAINQIKITIIEAGADNTFYVDNVFAESAEVGQFIMIR